MLKKHDAPVENRRFNTTHWSVVLRACQSKPDTEKESWNELVETYWFPLYAYCRRQRKSHQDAQDLIQSFFVHLMTAASLETVTPVKGRFRSFLLASLRNFISNWHRNSTTVRRGGGCLFFSLSADDVEAKYARSSAAHESPERAFDRDWVQSLLMRTKSRLAIDYERANKRQLFELLEPHLMCEEAAIPRTEIGKQLQMSQPAVAMSIHRMRRRYGEILLNEVSRTVDDPADTLDELRCLMEIVRTR